ncbi:MAG: hypothetical protein QXV69_01415 [Sulfolobaceae archaeon]
MIDLYKYPFLKNLEEEIKKYGSLKFADILNSSLIELAKERLEHIRKGDKNLKNYKEYGNKSILVFYTLVTIISLSQNERLKELFATVEAENFIRALEQESDDDILEFCNMLSVPVTKSSINIKILEDRRIKVITLPYSLDVIRYLKIIKDTKNENLKLYNQILYKGKVYLNRQKLLELIKHVIIKRLKELIRPLESSKELEELREKLGIKTRKITPPCMEEIKRKIESNENLSEEEIKTYITYLINIGYPKDTIKLIFERIGIQNIEEIIDEFRRRKYIVYSCSIMKKMNMCVSECNVINPLQLYYS